jgi:RNA methyltransferase, TrmH family
MEWTMSSSAPLVITSLTNERVKAIRALEMRKERKETGLFVVEGAAIIETARKHGFTPQTLVYQVNMEQTRIHRGLIAAAREHGADILEVSEAVMSKLASKDNPQSMLAVFAQRWLKAPARTDIEKSSCWLALEEIRDPGNLGTIIRTADAVGAAGILLIGNCVDAFSHDTVRATMGSIFSIPLVRLSREEFLAWRADWAGDVIGTHLDATDDFRKITYKEPTLIVMGSEGPGLTDSLTRACSRLVRIPMASGQDSLNLAVATALTLYQARGARLTV